MSAGIASTQATDMPTTASRRKQQLLTKASNSPSFYFIFYSLAASREGEEGKK